MTMFSKPEVFKVGIEGAQRMEVRKYDISYQKEITQPKCV